MTSTSTWFTLRGIAEWVSRTQARDLVRTLLPRSRARQPDALPRNPWEPGEQELYRTELRSASLLVAYQHARLWDRAICLLSNRRLILCVPRGDSIQLSLREIRAVNAHHHWNGADGFSYWVAIYKVRSDFSDNRGNICLVCQDRQQSHELASQIERAIVSNR